MKLIILFLISSTFLLAGCDQPAPPETTASGGGLGYPMATKDIKFIFDMLDDKQSLTETSAARQKITVVSASDDQPVEVIQDSSRQITCVQGPQEIREQCMRDQQQDFEDKRSKAWASIPDH